MRPDTTDWKPERAGFRLEIANLKSKRADWRPERADLWPDG